MNDFPDDLDVAESGTAVDERPAPVHIGFLPRWNVLLHNDDVNAIEDVVRTIVELTPLRKMAAVERTLEAHTRGVTLLLSTHREHAELLEERFRSCQLTVTIEPNR